MRKAEIRMFDKLAGHLEETDEGYTFAYAADYVNDPGNPPVSLLLPRRSEPYRDKRLFPFAEKTWKLDPRDRMGLLLATCRNCIGAVSVVPMEDTAT